MEKVWKRSELEKMTKPELQKILIIKGQNATGFKEQLIKRILGESRPEYTRKSTKPEGKSQLPIEPPREIVRKSELELLPYDVQLLPLYKLNYEDIANICRSSKTLNRVCKDERFWKEYADKNNINKTNPQDTWKETVKYYGKMTRFSGEYILQDINWHMYEDPKEKLEYFDKEKEEFIPLTKEEYNQIVFKKPVKVFIPKLVVVRNFRNSSRILQDYGKFKKGQEVAIEENWEPRSDNVIEVKPNTTYGITVIHLLDSIYRGIWGLPKNENRPLNTLIKDPHFLMGHPYFGGLYIYKNPYVRIPPEFRNIYKVNAGS
jgi:hypothetical protein